MGPAHGTKCTGHNGGHFDAAQHRDNMADQHGLSTIPVDDHVDGHGAVASPVQHEFISQELNLEMGQIPVVTQNSQQGE